MLTSPSNSKSTESSSLDEPSAVESTPRTRGLPGGSGSSGAFLAAYHVEWDLVADAVPIGSVTLSSGAASGSSFRVPLSARGNPRGSASSGERASSGESETSASDGKNEKNVGVGASITESLLSLHETSARRFGAAEPCGACERALSDAEVGARC